MKKIVTLLSLAAAAGALALSAVGAKHVEESKADPATKERYIPTDSFGTLHMNYDKSIGDLLRGRNERFWSGGSGFDAQERTFNAMDTFADSIHRAGGEGWTGAIQSPDITLTNSSRRYISFLFGGGAEGAEGKIFINIWSPSLGRNVVEDIRPKFDGSGSFDESKPDDQKLNAPVSCNMAFFYLELPSELVGETFAVYVKDEKTGGYGGFTFGNLYVDQTIEDVARHFSAHKNQMKLNRFTSKWNENACNYVINTTYADSYYDTVKAAEANLRDADDDFETNVHLTNWAYDMDHSRYPNNDIANLNWAGIYSDVDEKYDEGYFSVGMPMNQTGDYYLRAEFESSGVYEDASYRLVSPSFKLSGAGFVSAKLGGGTAVLEVLDENDNVLASSATAEAVDENKLRPGFHGEANREETFNIALSGVRLNTMSRVYLDVSSHIGETVKVSIKDARTGFGWGLAYFDEIKTYYSSTPSFKVEVCRQADHYVTVPDEYVGSNSTAFGKAFAFWRNYLSVLREGSTQYCSERTSDAVKSLLNEYKDLSEAAQRIVCASQDYQRVGEGTWYDVSPSIREANDQYSISHSLAYLAAENGVSGVVVYGNAGIIQSLLVNSENQSSTVTLIAIVAIVSVMSLSVLLIIKKRKITNKQ